MPTICGCPRFSRKHRTIPNDLRVCIISYLYQRAFSLFRKRIDMIYAHTR